MAGVFGLGIVFEKKEETEVVSLRVPASIRERLDRCAKDEGVSRNAAAAHLLRAALDIYEAERAKKPKR